MVENSFEEYKRELTPNFEREVVAFLNKSGGDIYLGIDDNENVIGINDIDGTQCEIKDRLKHNIEPSIMGLFDVNVVQRDGKKIIKVTVAKGVEAPYYLKKYGLTEKGCFVRIGSTVEPMQKDEREALFNKRLRNSIGKIPAPRDGLTFAQLKIYYEEMGLALNEFFMQNLELLTPDGKPNYAAYLLADENGVSLQVAKYGGKDRVNLIENKNYGRCSLVKAAKNILERLNIENTVYTKITRINRIEKPILNMVAVREAVINAVVHNDYTNGAVPKFEIFSDRLEITSAGGLPYGVTIDEFFNGRSCPRNKEIMRVFCDLEMVEALGTGMPRILNVYGKEAFDITTNFMNITFKFDEEALKLRDENLQGFDETTRVKNEKTKVKNDKKTKVKNDGTSTLVSDDNNLNLLDNLEKTEVKNNEKTEVKNNEKTKVKNDEFSKLVSSSNDLSLSDKQDKPKIKMSLEVKVKNLSKTSDKILAYMQDNPLITREMLAKLINISLSGIDWNIRKLKKAKKIKRVGTDKLGYWEVVKNKKS